MIQAVVLAGGLGTRLRPLTEKIPKPLVEVSGRPFLFWQLKDLRAQGIERVLLLVSYLGKMIADEFGEGRDIGLELTYSVEKEPLGTGGALALAREKLEKDFLLLNGDSFLRAPLAEMVKSFRESNYGATISSFSKITESPVTANLKIAQGQVLDYDKSGGAGFTLIDSGIYCLNSNVLNSQNKDNFQLEELWPGLIKNQALGHFPVNEQFYDVGTTERLKIFQDKIDDYF